MTEREKRVQWFQEARFGMFLHWGLYAIPGRGEWYMSGARMPAKEYERYMQEFTAKAYDPRDWARRAKRAGMQYVVLTAKHHDGFCLFDSKLTDYKSTNAPCGRDLVREFVDAVRAEGLRVGLYYSLIDWHHPDFPKYNDPNHPMRGNPAYREEQIDFDRYLAYMHGQVEELVTNYGKIDILWFDFAYGELRGEAWKATKLMQMAGRHRGQPARGQRRGLRKPRHGAPGLLQRRFRQPRAASAAGGHPQCPRRARSVGALRDDEQQLGLCAL